MTGVMATCAAVAVLVMPVVANDTEYSRVHTQGEESFLFNLGPTGMWGYGPKAIRRSRNGKDPDFITKRGTLTASWFNMSDSMV